MDPNVIREPWQKFEELLASGRTDELQEFMAGLSASEKARALSRLSEVQQAAVLKQVGPAAAADVIDGLSCTQAAKIIGDLPTPHAAAIVDELDSDERADILGKLSEENVEAILDAMAPGKASDARILMQYGADTAGGLMIREFLAYPDTLRIADVLDDLRTQAARYSDYEVQYAYIVSANGALVGVLPLRDLLLSSPTRHVREVMIPNPLSVLDTAPLRKLINLFDEHAFLGFPVVDANGVLVGAVRRAEVEEASKRLATRNFLRTCGIVGQEELRSMPLHARSSRRLSWLSINIVLNLIAASVIALYQDTLQAVIALAVFLPIISDMSGCSGNQAVAVSIRELTLGLIRPYEFLRVFLKESSVGVVNGISLGALLAGAAWLWQRNLYFSLVVGAAMMLNTVVAVSLGGLIPLALKSLKLDPALASGPILTTVTDMCGFFLVLSFATALLPKL